MATYGGGTNVDSTQELSVVQSGPTSASYVVPAGYFALVVRYQNNVSGGGNLAQFDLTIGAGSGLLFFRDLWNTGAGSRFGGVGDHGWTMAGPGETITYAVSGVSGGTSANGKVVVVVFKNGSI